MKTEYIVTYAVDRYFDNIHSIEDARRYVQAIFEDGYANDITEDDEELYVRIYARENPEDDVDFSEDGIEVYNTKGVRIQ